MSLHRGYHAFCMISVLLAACGDGDDTANAAPGRIARARTSAGAPRLPDEERADSGAWLPVVPRGEPEVLAVRAGQYHVCAVFRDQQLRCWSVDGGESTGPTSVVDLGAGRGVVQVATGWQYACAQLDDGQVKCWGSANNVGQLGVGDTQPRTGPGELGDSLPAVDLGGEDVVQLDAGGGHTCAVLTGGSVKCWGQGFYLGLGDDEVRGDEPDEMGDKLPAVVLGDKVKALWVAAGPRGTCAVLDDDTVRCWAYGDAEPPVPLDGMAPRSLALGDNHACASFDDGQVRCWGFNNYGQLGFGPSCDSTACLQQEPTVVSGLSGVVKVSAGRFMSCALHDTGAITCWGDVPWDGFGGRELVVQPSGARFADPLGERLFAVDIDSTDWNTCALLVDGRISCWGSFPHCFLQPDGPESAWGSCGPLTKR